MLVGNKTDLGDKRQVKREDAENFAKNNELMYYETTAMTTGVVTDAFLKLLQAINEKQKKVGQRKLHQTYGTPLQKFEKPETSCSC